MNSSQNLTLNSDLALNFNVVSNQDLILNQINDISTCICKAKEFLQENSNEHRIMMTHIYNLSEL